MWCLVTGLLVGVMGTLSYFWGYADAKGEKVDKGGQSDSK